MKETKYFDSMYHSPFFILLTKEECLFEKRYVRKNRQGKFLREACVAQIRSADVAHLCLQTFRWDMKSFREVREVEGLHS